MRTLFFVLTQVVCLLLTLAMGHSLPKLLYFLNVITSFACSFAVGKHPFAYLIFSVGLLILSFFILIIGGEARENRIIAPPHSFGGVMIRLWLIQNTVFAFASVASYVALVFLSPPAVRRFLLDLSFFHLW
jgi:hypothetical protein